MKLTGLPIPVGTWTKDVTVLRHSNAGNVDSISIVAWIFVRVLPCYCVIAGTIGGLW